MNAANDIPSDHACRAYLRWLGQASPESIERVHARVLAHLSADQRLALMRAAATAARLPQRALEEPGMATPAVVARCLSQAQAREPGVLAQLLTLGPGPRAVRRLALPALAGVVVGAFAASVLAGTLDDDVALAAIAEGPAGGIDPPGPLEADSTGLDTGFDGGADLLSMAGDLFA